jgi:cation diffusion facilitator family transporter
VEEGSRRAVLVAFLANKAIAVAKGVGFLITGAASMLAESVHSLADTGNQLLLFLGARRAERPPTPQHPFGYGRERYFWSFVVALVLFSMGSLFSLNEGIEKLRHPHEIESPAVAIAILLVAMLFEGYALRTAVREAQARRGELSWWAFIRRSKAPELPVILLEDAGALVGLTLALVFIGLAAWTGNPAFDAAGSLGIGLLLGGIAILLATEMKSLLIGESASARVEQAIRHSIESHPRVSRLIHMRTLHLGPEELLVGVKVELDLELALPEAAGVINEIEARVRADTPSARVIYIEPDVLREGATA